MPHSQPSNDMQNRGGANPFQQIYVEKNPLDEITESFKKELEILTAISGNITALSESSKNINDKAVEIPIILKACEKLESVGNTTLKLIGKYELPINEAKSERKVIEVLSKDLKDICQSNKDLIIVLKSILEQHCLSTDNVFESVTALIREDQLQTIKIINLLEKFESPIEGLEDVYTKLDLKLHKNMVTMATLYAMSTILLGVLQYLYQKP